MAIANRLALRQLARIRPIAAQRMLKGERGLALAADIFQHVNSELVLDKVKDHLVQKVLEGDNKAIQLLSQTTTSNKPFNRYYAVDGLSEIAIQGQAIVLNDLIRVAMTEKQAFIAKQAVKGISALANKKNSRAITALVRILRERATPKGKCEIEAALREALETVANMGNKKIAKFLHDFYLLEKLF
jgi:hypothetical protein